MPATKELLEQRPFLINDLPAAACNEWRVGDTLPPHANEGWTLVYLRSGVVEEQCDTRVRTLRSGTLLFHQPNEAQGTRAVGELPPELLRITFACDGAAMDLFRGCVLRPGAAEKACLTALAERSRELFLPPATPADPPTLRTELPFGAGQFFALQLEQLLILLARRLQRPKKLSPRAKAEQEQTALVETVRSYFGKNIEQGDLTLAQTCAANDCRRATLQAAFRARTHLAPMEYFSRMRLEQAAQLLAQGYTPGQVVARLHYHSAAHFAHRFKALCGQTPSAYRKAPAPLHLCEDE